MEFNTLVIVTFLEFILWLKIKETFKNLSKSFGKTI